MISVEDIQICSPGIVKHKSGDIYHMLRKDDPHFIRFGEIYFSTVKKGEIKGWHRHNKMNLNYVCISGRVKVVVYDGNKFKEVYLSPKKNEYKLLTIPRKLWNAFYGCEDSIVANCSTHPFTPGEKDDIDPYLPLVEGIPYKW